METFNLQFSHLLYPQKFVLTKLATLFVGENGIEITEVKYDYNIRGYEYSDGLMAVKLGGKWGFIDKSGKEIIEPKYDEQSGFINDICNVRIGNKWGVINKSGQMIVPLILDENPGKLTDGALKICIDDKYGFVDETGKFISDCIYDDASSFSEGLAAVKQNGKWGFIDKFGKVLIPFIYDRVKAFSDGYAAVMQNGKWGYLNTVGCVTIPLKYDSALSFNNGIAWVKMYTEKGFNRAAIGIINKDGKELTPIKYEFDDNLDETPYWEYVIKSGKLSNTSNYILKFDTINVLQYRNFEREWCYDLLKVISPSETATPKEIILCSKEDYVLGAYTIKDIDYLLKLRTREIH